MPPPTFQEIYCRRHKLAPGDYERRLVRDGLYWHARLLRWALRLWGGREYFLADREFVRHVGELTEWRGFGPEADEFHRHHHNGRYARRVLRLRVSAGRLGRLVRRELSVR
jgi:hypothetical protein